MDGAPTSPVRVELTGPVAVLRLDRPETRNALDTAMLRALAVGLERAAADDAVRAVVLTGGPRLFAAGADVRELRETRPTDYLFSERRRIYRAAAAFPKPIVAAVAGPALGGGCELALGCDMIVAGDNALFGQPEIRLGIMPGAGGTQYWSRAVGRYRAAEVVLAARTLTAWEALRLGLASRVVPAERIVAAGIELAEQVAAFSPPASRAAKAAVTAAEEMPLGAALDHECTLMTTLLSTDDHLEGIDAFLERRMPRFRGR